MTRDTIAEAIRDFPFWDYGMDDVDEIKGELWVDHLAEKITKALTTMEETDVRRIDRSP